MLVSKFFLSIFFAFVFICDGILINFFQLILYLCVKPFNLELYRSLNYYLIYSSWCQIVGLAQHWSKNDLTVYFADKESKQLFGKEKSICIMNHKYEIDWLYAWFIMDNLKCLGSAKSYVKKSLKWIPVIGWNFLFGEFIFLERNWEKDSLIMKKSLDNLMQYKQVVNLLLFSEGTRFTKQKYEKGVLFAKEQGLKILKHHLVPRAKGFNFTIKYLKYRLPAIYNIHIEFSNSENLNIPNFISVLKCFPLKGHVYIKRIPLSEISFESDDTINEFLYNLYIEKDKLTDYFIENNRFEGEYIEEIKPRLAPLLNMIFWIITIVSLNVLLLYVLISYHFYKLLISSVLIFSIVVITILILLVRSTCAVQGSTYGAVDSSKKKTT